MNASVQTTLPTSRHFQLEQVAEGIWAAISIPGAGSMSNAGIVDLGDRTLVFDSFFTPQAAEDLCAAAEQLTRRPASTVINSHFHGDHVHGNQVFAESAEVIATTRTRELIAERTARFIQEHQADLAATTESLHAEEARLVDEPDDRTRQTLARGLATQREYAAALPGMRQRLPTLTFEHRIDFYGSRRRAELLSYGGGHTDSDAILFLPDDGVAFLGDLLVVRAHPWMGHGHPHAWLSILERIEALDIAVAVPGHGPVGTRADCAALRAYIAAIVRLAHEAVAAGLTAEELRARPMPLAWAELDAAEVFDWNMAFLHAYVSRPESEQS